MLNRCNSWHAYDVIAGPKCDILTNAGMLTLILNYSNLYLRVTKHTHTHTRTHAHLWIVLPLIWPPLWSSGQSFWRQIQRSRVRFPALPDFLSSSGSGTGFTQPREVNWGATWIKSSGSGPENRDQRPWGSVALTTWHPSIRKSWH